MQALSKVCAVFSKLQLHSHTNNNSQHSKLKFLVPVATYCAIIIQWRKAIDASRGVLHIIIHVKTAMQEDLDAWFISPYTGQKSTKFTAESKTDRRKIE